MDITITLPDVFGKNKDSDLKVLAFLLRRNFPSLKNISIHLVPRLNEHGFEHIPQVNAVHFSKLEKVVRIYDTVLSALKNMMLRHAGRMYIAISDTVIFINNTFGIRNNRDMYFTIGNSNIETQITGFIQCILLHRMPDAVDSIVEYSSNEKQEYSIL